MITLFIIIILVKYDFLTDKICKYPHIITSVEVAELIIEVAIIYKGIINFITR